MIRATDIDAGRIIDDNLLRVDPNYLPLERAPYLKEGEVIVVRSGAYTGDSAIVPPRHVGAIAGYDMVVTVRGAVTAFVAHCLLSAYVLEGQLLLLTLRAAQPHLNAEQLGGIQMYLPAPTEQERIAAYLDASCAAIDAAVAGKRRQLETLADARESLIEATVTKGVHPSAKTRRINEDWVAEIPAHWEACRIKRVVSRVDYGISQSSEPEGRYPVLKMGHIQRGEIEYRDLDFVNEVSDNLLLEAGDLLYNRTNSPDQVAKAAVFRGRKAEEITFASYLVRLRTNHRADPYFLNYLLNCNGFLSFARKIAIPSVQQSNLNSTRYCRMLIPRPPIEEQREIAVFLDSKLGELGRVVTSIELQIGTLIAYRKSLIHECVTGQRRVTDADARANTERVAVGAGQELTGEIVHA
jgi:type I restriction enzyme S subunit